MENINTRIAPALCCWLASTISHSIVNNVLWGYYHGASHLLIIIWLLEAWHNCTNLILENWFQGPSEWKLIELKLADSLPLILSVCWEKHTKCWLHVSVSGFALVGWPYILGAVTGHIGPASWCGEVFLLRGGGVSMPTIARNRFAFCTIFFAACVYAHVHSFYAIIKAFTHVLGRVFKAARFVYPLQFIWRSCSWINRAGNTPLSLIDLWLWSPNGKVTVTVKLEWIRPELINHRRYEEHWLLWAAGDGVHSAVSGFTVFLWDHGRTRTLFDNL